MATQQPRDASVESYRAPDDVLIVGVGNETRGDDGVGPRVVGLLLGRVPPRVRVATVATDPLAIIDAWEGAARVIVVDAMCTGAEPGHVERLDLSAPGAGALLTAATPSSHGFGLAGSVALARILRRLPSRVIVYGIEAATLEPGAPLSPGVAAAAVEVAERILGELAAP